MAIIFSRHTGRRAYLRSPHVFGRNSGANTILENPDASQIHASVRWNGECWEINDHSRNGTLVDGKALVRGTGVALQLGQIIQFGVSNLETWQVESIAPPCAMLVPVRGEDAPIELAQFNLLPNEQHPELSLYISPQGQWVIEDDHSIMAIKDGEILTLAGQLWKFLTVTAADSTLEAMPRGKNAQRDIEFQFHVSQDEEHTSMKVVAFGREVDLGERTHHYCLLTLARKRLSDATQALDPDSQGWVELKVLAKMLGLEPSHVNIQIFRARNQLSDAFLFGEVLPNAVERRRGSIRFSVPKFMIMRGSHIEGVFPAQANQAIAHTLDESQHDELLVMNSNSLTHR